MPSTSPAHTAAALPFNETKTGMVFTPFILLVLVFLALLTLVIFTTLVFTTLRRRCAALQIDHQTVDVEAQHVKGAYFEVVDHGAKSASLWSRLFGRMTRMSSREPEPELPWPVYNILPHLRPKAPLHIRLLKTLTSWRKDECKHEPFTVADVQRAKEDLEARTQASVTACVVREEERTRCWWTSVKIPEIVIHPCDNTPLKYAESAYTMAAIPSKPIDVVSKLSLASTSPVVDELPSFMPLEESAAVQPLPSMAELDTLEVPMPSSTAPKEKRMEDDVINVSNISGKAFTLGEPPKREVPSELRATTTGDDMAGGDPVVGSSATADEVDDDFRPSPSASEPDTSIPPTPVAQSVTSLVLASIPTAPSSPDTVDVDSCYSPASTASEPDSPMPLTPLVESYDFPFILIPAPVDVLEISAPPSNVIAAVKSKGMDVGSPAFEAGHYWTSGYTGPGSPLRVGLGLSYEEVQRREEEEPQFIIGELSPANSYDSTVEDLDEVAWWLKGSSSISSSSSKSSAHSAPDIMRVLSEASTQSFVIPSRMPFAGIREALERYVPSSESGNFSIGTSSSQSTYYDILHHYRDADDVDDDEDKDNSDNASVASGRSDYYDACSNQASACGRTTTLRWGADPTSRAPAREQVALSCL